METKIPENIKSKFNWGAFFLHWMWGLGNKSYATLLIFLLYILFMIPYVNLFAMMLTLPVSIYFGIKGNEWAWNNNHWDSEEHFDEVQKNWAIAGLILSIISMLFLVLAIWFIFVPILFIS